MNARQYQYQISIWNWDNHNCDGKTNEGEVCRSPQFLTAEDVPGAEEGDAWEPQVLVQHEDAHWDEVRVTEVVDEAADVAIVSGVDAVHFPVLGGGKNKSYEAATLDTLSLQRLMFADLIVQVEQVGVVFPDIGLRIRDQLPDVSVGTGHRSSIATASCYREHLSLVFLGISHTRR